MGFLSGNVAALYVDYPLLMRQFDFREFYLPLALSRYGCIMSIGPTCASDSSDPSHNAQDHVCYIRKSTKILSKPLPKINTPWCSQGGSINLKKKSYKAHANNVCYAKGSKYGIVFREIQFPREWITPTCLWEQMGLFPQTKRSMPLWCSKLPRTLRVSSHFGVY